MEFSDFGGKFSSAAGIMVLMDDLGRAMAGSDGMLMLGGGNPAHIPEVQAIWRRRMEEILKDRDSFERMLTNYDTPQGDPRFVEEIALFFNRNFGWKISPANVAVMNGGQTAFFCLLNMLSGPYSDGSKRRILFPLMPEYIGYADQNIYPGTFFSNRPLIEMRDRHMFKYKVDFDGMSVPDDIAAICVSRPTNPTGNVLTNTEMERLSGVAGERGIPLIVDNAYGLPFPGIVFGEFEPIRHDHMILTLSLSKLGLPGTRTGIVIAPEEIVRTLSAMNSIFSLANGNIGQCLVRPLLENDEILRMSREIIRPFYMRKSRQAIECVRESFDDSLDYHIHESEGALFLWLWFRDLPITDMELYERLKRRGVLVVPGTYFFYGLERDWRHSHECIRVTYSQSDDVVRKGIRIIAEEVGRAYAGKAQ